MMRRTYSRWFLALAAGLLCAGGGVFLWRSGFFAAATSQEALRAYIQQFAPYSHLCFFLLQLLSVVLAPIPSNVTALAGGVLFGTLPAFLMTYAAVALGYFTVGMFPGTSENDWLIMHNTFIGGIDYGSFVAEGHFSELLEIVRHHDPEGYL